MRSQEGVDRIGARPGCRQRPRPLALTLLASTLLVWLSCAHADEASPSTSPSTSTSGSGPTVQDAPPQGGQQAQALPEPGIPAKAERSFVLQSVEFVGAAGVAESELQAAVADRIGESVKFADLEQLAAVVTEVYRKRGYVLARAFLPVQEVTDGRVRISISEGLLGNVGIEMADGAPVSQARVAKTLAILEPGKPLNGKQYERAMLLLTDLPGVKPHSTASAGAVRGTTDLTVQIAGRDRVQYALELDDYGTGDSGRYRITGSLRWASPFGRGDNLDLRLMLAEGAHTVFGRVSYETPVGYTGLRVGAGLARVQYELGGPFAPLKPTGEGTVTDLSWSYPLIRQRNVNLFLRGMLDRKELTDRYEAVGFKLDKRVQGVGVGFAFERRDKFGGGGYTSANGVLYRGNLDIRDPVEAARDRIVGYGVGGSFAKLTLQAARLQYLTPKMNLFVSGGLQRASKNLDAYEQLSLGGPKAVRAYATGELLVDDGWLATAELRYAATPETTLFAFYDGAHGDLHHDPKPWDVARSLRGYGLGINWGRPGVATMQLTLAWRGTGPALTDTGAHDDPRLYWSIQKAF